MVDRFPLFTGNCPNNVSRDAKYRIRTWQGGLVVALWYERSDEEVWLATTEEHPELVEMVNTVKTTIGDAPNGPFYLNEYGQVIVPVGPEARYHLAGEYDGLLQFQFGEHLLSGQGVDLAGRPLAPGDQWPGPHPGIPYIVEANRRDIRYETHPQIDILRKVRLSKYVGPEAAAELAERILRVKGDSGRFYVNEWREIFAPVTSRGDLTYVYVGHLELDDPWYPQGDSMM